MLDISADHVGPLHISVRLKRLALPGAAGALNRYGRLVFEWTAEGLRASAEADPGAPAAEDSAADEA
jgi:hypothetical protein